MINETDEAEIEASRAPLLDHLIELRSRLIKSLAAFVVMFFGCFFFSRHIYNILVYPYVSVVGVENAKLIATHLGLALRAVHDGVGYWATFEGYVRYGVKSGALVSVLDDWCPPFDGPFLY